MVAKKNISSAIAVLGLVMAGAAFAGTAASSTPSPATVVDVTVLEGKLKLSPTLKLSATTVPAGLITLVVVNRGATTHGLAIMGNGLSQKRVPTLAVGKRARITVTLKAGTYHLWDPVQGSMRRAKRLIVSVVKTSSSGSNGSSADGSGYTPRPGGAGTGGSGSTWTTCIDPVTGEDHGPMDHPCDF